MCKIPIESSREKEFLSKIFNFDNYPPEDKYKIPENLDRFFLPMRRYNPRKIRRRTRRIRESI